jgi:hypothetical protein
MPPEPAEQSVKKPQEETLQETKLEGRKLRWIRLDGKRVIL